MRGSTVFHVNTRVLTLVQLAFSPELTQSTNGCVLIETESCMAWGGGGGGARWRPIWVRTLM